MALVFGDPGLDLRQFPNLVPQGLGIGAAQGCSAAATGRRHAGDDLLALFSGEERPLVFGVARLAAGAAWRLRRGAGRLGMRVLPGAQQQGARGDKTSGHSDQKSTAQRLGEAFNVGEKTIRRDARFAEAVDQVVENCGQDSPPTPRPGPQAASRCPQTVSGPSALDHAATRDVPVTMPVWSWHGW